MACSGSLTPCFVNNYITAEIIYSTVHVHHEVLAWSWVTLCGRDVWAPPPKSGGITSASRLCLLGQPWEERIQRVRLLWLPHQPGENKRLCGSLSFLPASLFAPCLSCVQGTVCTVRYSETIDVINTISNIPSKKKSDQILSILMSAYFLEPRPWISEMASQVISILATI